MGTQGPRANGLYPRSALISNLNRQSLESVAAPMWKPSAMFWIPPTMPSLPLFLGVIGHERGLELCGAAPAGLASGGRLEQSLRVIAVNLE